MEPGSSYEEYRDSLRYNDDDTLQYRQGYNKEEPEDEMRLHGLIAYLEERWAYYSNARQAAEEEWLAAYRAFLGRYSEETLQKIRARKSSEIFMHITRTKVVSQYSRIIDFMFKDATLPYSIKPSPIPELRDMPPQHIQNLAIMGGAFAAGAPAGLNQEQLMQVAERQRLDIQAKAKAASERMKELMDDQLKEGDFGEIMKAAIFEQVLFGTGVIKGPVAVQKPTQRWSRQVEGNYVGYNHEVVHSLVPRIKHVTVWNFFPDPDAWSMKDAEGAFEIEDLHPHHLEALIGKKNYDSSAIRRLLVDGPQESTLLSYETELQGLRNKTSETTGIPTMAGYISSGSHRRRGNVNRGKPYRIKKWTGHCDVEDLQMLGVDLPKEVWHQDSVEVCCEYCGIEVIKAIVNPYKTVNPLYKVFPYESITGAFWGSGVAVQMRDSQKGINTFMRLMLDGKARASAPISFTDSAQVDGADDFVPFPGMNYVFDSNKVQGAAQRPPVYWLVSPDVSHSMIEGVNICRAFADEETSNPSYTHGVQTDFQNKTATGMSMLMNNYLIGMKSVFKNIDDYCLRNLFEDYYHWNMQFYPDDAVKGDYEVIVSGTTSIMAREIQSQRLINFINTVVSYQPFSERLKPYDTLMELGKMFEIDTERILLNDEEYNAIQQQKLQLFQHLRALQEGQGIPQPGGVEAPGGIPGMGAPGEIVG